MKLNSETFYTLQQKIIKAFNKIKHFLLPDNTLSRGQPLSVRIIDTITLGVFRHQYGIEIKKDLYDLFRPECSCKTLVVNLNRFALLVLFIISPLVKENRKNADIVKYTDSTGIPVCLVKNARHHKTMRRLASWSKTGKGWFYGLKLHLTVDRHGKILSFCFTSGNVGDRSRFMRLYNVRSDIIEDISDYLNYPHNICHLFIYQVRLDRRNRAEKRRSFVDFGISSQT